VTIDPYEQVCALRCGLDRVGGLERLDLLGQFSNVRLRIGPRLCSRTGKARLQLVPQGGELGQVGGMREGHPHAGLVIVQLTLGDGEVLPDAGAAGAVVAGQAFQGVENGARPGMIPQEPGLVRGCPFEVQGGRAVQMQHQPEGQAAILAQGEPPRDPHITGQGFQVVTENGCHILLGDGAAAEGEGIGGMGRGGGQVGGDAQAGARTTARWSAAVPAGCAGPGIARRRAAS
jgi:hypothetical protein